MKPIRFLVIIAFGILLFQGCNTTSYIPLITQDTAVQRTQSIGIIGVRWIETYNDPETTSFITRTNEDLFKDKDNIAFQRVFAGKTLLHNPLTYLANFQLISQITGSTSDNFTIERFNLDLLEYFPNTIHSFEPGQYTLKTFRMDQYRLYRGVNEDPTPIVDQLYPVKFPLPEVNWKLNPGEITYMGDITFFLETKKIHFGIPPKPVVDKIMLKRIVYSDKFSEMMESMKKDNPWLPLDNINNQAKTGDWQWNETLEIWDEYKAPEKEKERDKTKFFF